MQHGAMDDYPTDKEESLEGSNMSNDSEKDNPKEG